LVNTFGNLVFNAIEQYSSNAIVFFDENEYNAAELNEFDNPEDESDVLIVTSS
jgi:hypothetical protein